MKYRQAKKLCKHSDLHTHRLDAIDAAVRRMNKYYAGTGIYYFSGHLRWMRKRALEEEEKTA